jgi:hypothetical protein
VKAPNGSIEAAGGSGTCNQDICYSCEGTNAGGLKSTSLASLKSAYALVIVSLVTATVGSD